MPVAIFLWALFPFPYGLTFEPLNAFLTSTDFSKIIHSTLDQPASLLINCLRGREMNGGLAFKIDATLESEDISRERADQHLQPYEGEKVSNPQFLKNDKYHKKTTKRTRNYAIRTPPPGGGVLRQKWVLVCADLKGRFFLPSKVSLRVTKIRKFQISLSKGRKITSF